MKSYHVNYAVTASFDTTVKAKNAKEAEAKVRKVIGEPVEIESVYEVRSNA